MAAKSTVRSTPSCGQRRTWCARRCSASSATPCPTGRFSTSSPAPASIGLEALSRGASFAVFVERDFRLAQEIEHHLRELRPGRHRRRSFAPTFTAGPEHWRPPREPVNVFLSPPFADFASRAATTSWHWSPALRRKVATGSVLVLQTEKQRAQQGWPDFAAWDERRYGRNVLLIWVKEQLTRRRRVLRAEFAVTLCVVSRGRVPGPLGGRLRARRAARPGPKDYDVATSALPEEVRRLFRRTVAVGVSFGVVEVLGPRDVRGPLKVEVATFRADVSYSDGRHPDAVVFASAREDALRRDFTINGMFFDPLEGQARRLRGRPGGPAGARPARHRRPAVQRSPRTSCACSGRCACATDFDLAIEPATAAAIQPMADQITVVSAERIAKELRQIAGGSAARARRAPAATSWAWSRRSCRSCCR